MRFGVWGLVGLGFWGFGVQGFSKFRVSGVLGVGSNSTLGLYRAEGLKYTAPNVNV